MHPVPIVVTDGFTLNPGGNPFSAIEPRGALTVQARSSVRSVAGGGAGTSRQSAA